MSDAGKVKLVHTGPLATERLHFIAPSADLRRQREGSVNAQHMSAAANEQLDAERVEEASCKVRVLNVERPLLERSSFPQEQQLRPAGFGAQQSSDAAQALPSAMLLRFPTAPASRRVSHVKQLRSSSSTMQQAHCPRTVDINRLVLAEQPGGSIHPQWQKGDSCRKVAAWQQQQLQQEQEQQDGRLDAGLDSCHAQMQQPLPRGGTRLLGNTLQPGGGALGNSTATGDFSSSSRRAALDGQRDLGWDLDQQLRLQHRTGCDFHSSPGAAAVGKSRMMGTGQAASDGNQIATSPHQSRFRRAELAEWEGLQEVARAGFSTAVSAIGKHGEQTAAVGTSGAPWLSAMLARISGAMVSHSRDVKDAAANSDEPVDAAVVFGEGQDGVSGLGRGEQLSCESHPAELLNADDGKETQGHQLEHQQQVLHSKQLRLESDPRSSLQDGSSTKGRGRELHFRHPGVSPSHSRCSSGSVRRSTSPRKGILSPSAARRRALQQLARKRHRERAAGAVARAEGTGLDAGSSLLAQMESLSKGPGGGGEGAVRGKGPVNDGVDVILTQGTDALVVKWKEIERQWQQQQAEHQERQRVRQQQEQKQQQDQQQLDDPQLTTLSDSISFAELPKAPAGAAAPIQDRQVEPGVDMGHARIDSTPGVAARCCDCQSAPVVDEPATDAEAAVRTNAPAAPGDTTSSPDSKDISAAWCVPSGAVPAALAVEGAIAEPSNPAAGAGAAVLFSAAAATATSTVVGEGRLGQEGASCSSASTGRTPVGIQYRLAAGTQLPQQETQQQAEAGTSTDAVNIGAGDGAIPSPSSEFGLTLVMAAAAAAAVRAATPQQAGGSGSLGLAGGCPGAKESSAGGDADEENVLELAELILNAFRCEGGVIAADAGGGAAFGLGTVSGLHGVKEGVSGRVLHKGAMDLYGAQPQRPCMLTSAGRGYVKVTDSYRPPLNELDATRASNLQFEDLLGPGTQKQPEGVGGGSGGSSCKVVVDRSSRTCKSTSAQQALRKSQACVGSTGRSSGRKQQQQEDMPCCFAACKHHLVPATEGRRPQQPQQQQQLISMTTGEATAQRTNMAPRSAAWVAPPTAAASKSTTAVGGPEGSHDLLGDSPPLDEFQLAEHQQRWRHAVEVLHASGVRLAPESVQACSLSTLNQQQYHHQQQQQPYCEQQQQQRGFEEVGGPLGCGSADTDGWEATGNWQRGHALQSPRTLLSDVRTTASLGVSQFCRAVARSAPEDLHHLNRAAGHQKDDQQEVAREVREVSGLMKACCALGSLETAVLCKAMAQIAKA